jgi:Leucine-rich repeat (LRR) protein
LEILTLFNNQIEELPTAISSLPKLRILNVGMNRLVSLGRGFGACPSLEILDLSHNKLSEEGLPGNFWMMETLRALYMGDNYFQTISPEIGRLKNLQIFVIRNNVNLSFIPREIGYCTRLRELHVQGNLIQWLPPEIGSLDLGTSRSIIRLEDNPLAPVLADQWALGPHHLLDYVKTEAYKTLYNNSNRGRR